MQFTHKQLAPTNTIINPSCQPNLFEIKKCTKEGTKQNGNSPTLKFPSQHSTHYV